MISGMTDILRNSQIKLSPLSSPISSIKVFLVPEIGHLLDLPGEIGGRKRKRTTTPTPSLLNQETWKRSLNFLIRMK
jgi:hypothetical protein